MYLPKYQTTCSQANDMSCFARFGTIYTILKTWQTHTEEDTLSKVAETSAWDFTKSIIPPWVFFTFFTLQKWEMVPSRAKCLIE